MSFTGSGAVPFSLCQVQDGGIVDVEDAKNSVNQPAVVSLASQTALSNGRHSGASSLLAEDHQRRNTTSPSSATPRGK